MKGDPGRPRSTFWRLLATPQPWTDIRRSRIREQTQRALSVGHSLLPRPLAEHKAEPKSNQVDSLSCLG